MIVAPRRSAPPIASATAPAIPCAKRRGAGAMAVGVHTLTYLTVMALAAWVVYRKLGLNLLRKAWFNLDWPWAGALLITGMVVLFT